MGLRGHPGIPLVVESSVSSQLQQSLQLWHFGQRWLSHASFVQLAQMMVDSSSQILQKNGIGKGHLFFRGDAGSREMTARHR